jgi:cell division septation protein DedD
MTSAANSRVLEFSSGSTKLDTTFTEIPSLQSTAPTETKTILEDEGDGARLSRIWVQGKNYGYEFPGKTVPVTEPVVASSQTRADTPQNYVRPATPSELAEVQTAETPAPTPVALQAQAQPQPAPITPAPQNPTSVVAQATPTPVTDTPPIPATALGWVSILFAGLTVAAVGLFLFLRSERSAR